VCACAPCRFEVVSSASFARLVVVVVVVVVAVVVVVL
jgi:hypothetical protein